MLPKKKIELPHTEVFLKCFVSKDTKRAYSRDLKLIENYLNSAGIPVEEFTYKHAVEFRATLVPKYSVGTANRILACLKSYIRTLIRFGTIERNPAEELELFPVRYAPTPQVSDEDVSKLLRAVESNRLHSAVMHVLFYLGLRRSEVCSLQVDSLGAEMGIATISVLGKGGKNRTLPLPGPVFEAVKLYLATSRASIRETKEPLFTVSGKPLHPNTIAKIVKSACKKAGIESVSPHSARVTCVSNALENGASLHKVQALGGWSDPSMVIRYDRRRNDLKNSAAFAVKYKNNTR